MATIAINDLDAGRTLDRQAMSAIRGGGAPWVFGWIRPYMPAVDRSLPMINYIQVNNYYADQMINQFQVVDVKNAAPNSVINVGLDEGAANRGMRALA